MKWLARHAPDHVFRKPPIGDAGIPSEQRNGPRGPKTTNVLERIANQFAQHLSWRNGPLLGLQSGCGDSDHLVNEPLPVPIDRIRTPDEAWTGQQSHAQPTQELAPTGGKLTEAVVSFCFCYRAFQSFP